MHNFYDLEKRYKKYIAKFYLKIFLSFAVLIGVFYVGYISVFQDIEKPKEVKKVEKVSYDKKVVKKEHKIEKVEKNRTVVKIEKEKRPFLKPSLNIELFEYKESEKKEKVTPKKDKKIKEYNTTSQVDTIKVKESNKTETKEIKKSPLIISEELPSFESAFKIMNNFYNEGDYKKSIEWALKCDKIKRFDEDVWNIYALSLYKLNNRDKAISVLKTYLKLKKSDKLKKTLDLIQKDNN